MKHLTRKGISTIGELREWAVQCIEGAGRSGSRRSADWLLEDVTGIARAEIIAYPERSVSEVEEHRFRQMVSRRVKGEPLQYILGWTEFYGIRLRVTEDVLIPRPETELLVEAVLEQVRAIDDPVILDVGTGSGCIAIAIASQRPDARVTAIDNSLRAIDVAKRNAAIHGADIRFAVVDILSGALPGGLAAACDVVVSNPPYIHPSEAESLEEEVVMCEPEGALFTSDDSLEFYRALVSRCGDLLRVGGSMVVEAHADRTKEVAAILLALPFNSVIVREDLAGRERFVLGVGLASSENRLW